MPKKISIPFTTELVAGSRNTFRLLDDKQLTINHKISTISLFRVLDHLIKMKKDKNNNLKLNFEKGSKTKKYYLKLKK